MEIQNLRTPAFLVDQERMTANCERMASRAQALNVSLRPHVKTHKTKQGGRLQTHGSSGGITVSTLAEGRYFAEGGFQDITYAVPISPARLDEAAKLSKRVKQLNLLVDHPQTLAAMESFARANQLVWSVYLKIDCGYHRAGVDPEQPIAMEMARRLQTSQGIHFRGILTHAGHSYNSKTAIGAGQIAEQEVAVMVAFASQLRQAGIECPEVSIGSTPTCVNLKEATGITEIRPGNYCFFDRYQVDIGSCTPEEVAVTVLTTVIGHYPAHNKLILDAGALALSKDPGATHVNPDCGFGVIEGFPELKIETLSQECGKVSSKQPIDYEALPIGTKLRLVPNHSCLTAALFESYHVIVGNRVEEQWRPARGW